MSDKKASSSDQFNVRFPPGMRDKIAEAARQSGRSMNREIVERLAESLARIPVEALLGMSGEEMAAYDRMRRDKGHDEADAQFFPQAATREQFEQWVRTNAKLEQELCDVKHRLAALEKKGR